MKFPEHEISDTTMSDVAHILASAVAALDFVTDNEQTWESFRIEAEKTCGEEWGEGERRVMRENRDSIARMYIRIDHALGHMT